MYLFIFLNPAPNMYIIHRTYTDNGLLNDLVTLDYRGNAYIYVLIR